ncbi:hypothetical protein, partial [Paracoccus niistensis]
LTAPMIAVKVRVQREGEVVHLVVHGITDLSGELASVGMCEGSADGVLQERERKSRNTSAVREPHAGSSTGLRARNMYVRDLHLDTIKVKPRDFR